MIAKLVKFVKFVVEKRKDMKKILLMSLAALLLSSCGLYNKYERPEVNADGIVRDPYSLTDTLVVNDTVSFGNMPWRSVFTDPQLQALIQQGLDNNPDLLNAALNVKMMDTELLLSMGAGLQRKEVVEKAKVERKDGTGSNGSGSGSGSGNGGTTPTPGGDGDEG